MATTDKSALEGKVAAELHQMATDLGIEGHKGLKKAELVDKILAHDNGAPGGASAEAPARSGRAGQGRCGFAQSLGRKLRARRREPGQGDGPPDK